MSGCAFGHCCPLHHLGPRVTFRVSAVCPDTGPSRSRDPGVIVCKTPFSSQKSKTPFPSGLQVTACPTPASGHRCDEDVSAPVRFLQPEICPLSWTGPSSALGSPQCLPAPDPLLCKHTSGFFQTPLLPCSHAVPVAWPTPHSWVFSSPQGPSRGAFQATLCLSQGSGWMEPPNRGSRRGLPGGVFLELQVAHQVL